MAGSRSTVKTLKTHRKEHEGREVVPVLVAGKGRGARIGARYRDEEFSLICNDAGLAIPFKHFKNITS